MRKFYLTYEKSEKLSTKYKKNKPQTLSALLISETTSRISENENIILSWSHYLKSMHIEGETKVIL